MKFNRQLVTRKNLANLGIIVSTFFLLSQIFEMILSAFVYDYYSINNISDLIFDCFAALRKSLSFLLAMLLIDIWFKKTKYFIYLAVSPHKSSLLSLLLIITSSSWSNPKIEDRTGPRTASSLSKSKSSKLNTKLRA